MRAAVALLLSLLACSPPVPPPTPPAPAAPPAPPVAPPPVFTPQPPWEYSPSARDPFRTPLLAEPQPATDPALLLLCGPPCAWELEQLSLVGLVSGTASPLAVVEDPEGRGHVLELGSLVGSRGARVERILRTTLLVTERGAKGTVAHELRIQPARGQAPIDLLRKRRT